MKLAKDRLGLLQRTLGLLGGERHCFGNLLRVGWCGKGLGLRMGFRVGLAVSLWVPGWASGNIVI